MIFQKQFYFSPSETLVWTRNTYLIKQQLQFNFYNFPFLESLDLYGVINNDIDLPIILDLLLQEVEIESVANPKLKKCERNGLNIISTKKVCFNSVFFARYCAMIFQKQFYFSLSKHLCEHVTRIIIY